MEKIDGQVKKYNGSNWRWMQVTFEEHVKHMEYLAREKGREEGLSQGLKEGLDKGDAKARKEVAYKLKSAGMDFYDIAEATGLRVEEIENL